MVKGGEGKKKGKITEKWRNERRKKTEIGRVRWMERTKRRVGGRSRRGRGR